MNRLLIVGKYLDQPRLVGKFSNSVPNVLMGASTIFTLGHVCTTPQNERLKEFIKSTCVLGTTISSILFSTRKFGDIKFGKKILLKGFNGFAPKTNLEEMAKSNTELVNKFLKNNDVSFKTSKLLEKAKTKILQFSEIKTIFQELHKEKNGKEFLNKLIPDPENIDSKHIFEEIKRLSLIGLIPVMSGITGGIIGDRLTEKHWKERIPNKIKEGSYQYLANIFLCNIGAGAALAALERAKITSKAGRAIGMTTGIFAFGVIGGSAIANLIGRICIDPILSKKQKRLHNNKRHHHDYPRNESSPNMKGIYSERKPEALDIGLHADDIATVAVLSGLKWIEPALPVLYSISGYRAGIGYRNGEMVK